MVFWVDGRKERLDSTEIGFLQFNPLPPPPHNAPRPRRDRGELTVSRGGTVPILTITLTYH